ERYKVIEQMAAGGMGTLWRAHHVELDVDVALKVVSARAATPGSLKRFKREAQAAAKLRSPNIVQVLDYGEFDGQPYLAMELLRGEDLAERLHRGGKLPFTEVARILDGIAKGVQVAHDAGIVHRDLKPGNIFLEKIGDDEVVKILDFGIAKDLSAVAEPGSTTGAGVVGSPAYMSPEQVWQKTVGSHADVWAMGVVTFEMLTGKNPFFDETLAKIFERIIRDPLPKLGDFEAGLPPLLDAFFERALARSAAERIGSAKELAAQFRGAIDGRAPPPAPRFDAHATTQKAPEGPRAARTLRRRNRDGARRGRWALVVLGFLAAAGATLFAMTRNDAHREAEHDRRSSVEEVRAPGLSPREGPSGPSLQVAIPPAPLEPPSAPAKTPSAPSEAPRRAIHAMKQPTKPVSAPTAATSSTPATTPLDPKFGIPMNP
ncbi:MAG TPA: protein kinase, partial [Polyangiaceae bacterium]